MFSHWLRLLVVVTITVASVTFVGTHRAAAGAAATSITIDNFVFSPANITVPAGTELTWINKDDVPHTVVGSDAGSPLRSLPLDTNDKYSVVMDKPGTYKYFCSVHPHMVGVVVVK